MSTSTGLSVVITAVDDNPFIDPQYAERVFRSLPKRARDRLLKGKWTDAGESTMAKKAGTLIIEFLKGLQGDLITGYTISEADRTWMIRLMKRVDKRDQQNRKNTKPVVRSAAKKAARRRVKKSR